MVGSRAFLLIAIPFIVILGGSHLLVIFNGPWTPPLEQLPQIHTRAGNDDVAADVYGNGVRVGFYLQMVGILISTGVGNVGGVKIACGATMIALLVCWTKLAQSHSFSPCEADLIITLTSICSLTGNVAVLAREPGSFFGSFVLFFASIWSLVYNWWLWIHLYATLPRLNTKNLVFFFTSVRMDGWFRIFMIIQMVFLTIVTISSIVGGVVAEIEAADSRQENQQFMSEGQRRTDERQRAEEKEDRMILLRVLVVISFVVLGITIASAEMTIRYNNLQPTKTLSQPGQAIPLSVGGVVLVDSLVSILFSIIKSIDG